MHQKTQEQTVVNDTALRHEVLGISRSFEVPFTSLSQSPSTRLFIQFRIFSFLDRLDIGDNIICCELDAYSCKLVGFDKKLSKSLDRGFEFGSSPTELCGSPLGPLAESACRKTLIYLILTLNHVYPDYDFSLLRAHHFHKEDNLEAFQEMIQSNLQEVAKVMVVSNNCFLICFRFGIVLKMKVKSSFWRQLCLPSIL